MGITSQYTNFGETKTSVYSMGVTKIIDKNRNNDCQGLGEGGMGRFYLMNVKCIRKDAKAPNMEDDHNGYGWSTISMHLMLLNCIFENG